MEILAIQSFGKENEYKRAVLTILSFYAHTSRQIDQTKILLFTDQPDWFRNYLKELPVHYILLTPVKIKNMRGEIDFLHRMKIALIEEAFNHVSENLLYADSDTFFTSDPTRIVAQISEGKSFMHLWEYEFKSMRDLPLPMGKTFHKFLDLIESRKFTLANGDSLQVSPNQVSWNAGVMFFHKSHARFIKDVYVLTDQFYPSTLNHASEQYAFSVMLQNNTELKPCDSVIYHYWYRIKKQIVDLFLEQQFNSQWAQLPLTEKLDDVKRWCAILPVYFEKHILTVQDNAIQSFNEGRFLEGIKYAMKAIVRTPLNLSFLKDVVYHTKRKLVK